MRGRQYAGVGLASIAVVVAVVLFFEVVLPTSRGAGPEAPPYSAAAIADCFRSLSGYADWTEGVRSGTHWLDGPSRLDGSAGIGAGSDYVRVEWSFDANADRGTKVQIYVARDEGAAALIFAKMLKNDELGYGGGEEGLARAVRNLALHGNAVLQWDSGHTRELVEKALSCLVN